MTVFVLGSAKAVAERVDVAQKRPPLSPAAGGFSLSSNMNVNLPASTQLKQAEELEKQVEGFSEFVAAAEVGNLNKMMDLLRRGVDVNKAGA